MPYPKCTFIIESVNECAVPHGVALAVDERFTSDYYRCASILAQVKQALAGTTTGVLVISRSKLDMSARSCVPPALAPAATACAPISRAHDNDEAERGLPKSTCTPS